MNYLFDSNIVIYFLGGFALNENALILLDTICKQEQNLSIISKLELLGFNFTSAANEEETKIFVAKSKVYAITPEIENPFDW